MKAQNAKLLEEVEALNQKVKQVCTTQCNERIVSVVGCAAEVDVLAN